MTVKKLKKKLEMLEDNTQIYIDITSKDIRKMKGYGMVSWDFTTFSPDDNNDLLFLELSKIVSC